MMSRMPRLLAVLLSMLGLVLVGCGGQAPERTTRSVVFDRADGPVDAPSNGIQSRAPKPVDPPSAIVTPTFDANGVAVLYDDDKWVVEEGQWWLGNIPEDESQWPRFDRILASAGPNAIVVVAPGFYGRYRVRVELRRTAPAVPVWCEDVAEASMRIQGPGSAFEMTSFETFSNRWMVKPGWYRVRYCTEKQDRASHQDEFTGNDYTVYDGRHLIQFWKAPQTPDEMLKTGSAFARHPGQSDSGD